MKAEELIQALGDVNDTYIEEAAAARPSRRALNVWRAIAIAACAVLATSAALALLSLNLTSYRSADTEGIYYEEDAGSYDTRNKTASDNYVRMAAMESAEEAYEVAEDYDYAEPETMAAGVLGALDGAAAQNTAGQEDADDALQEAKIIYTVYMDMQTKDFDQATKDIEALVSSYGGYCESQYQSNNTGAYRNANYVLRIPSDQLDAFLDQIGQSSTVTYVSKSAEDVSASYYDTKSRLDTAKAKLARLQELLAQAEDMEDLIAIESAISDVEWEIDNYSGTLKYYDSKVDYSTVTINLNEVYEVVIEEAPLTFGERISQAFTKGLKGFARFAKNLLLWLAQSWLWLVILVVVAVVIVLLVKRAKRRRQNKNSR